MPASTPPLVAQPRLPGGPGGYPATPPPNGKRGAVIAGSVAAGVLVVVLVVVGIVYAAGGDDTPGGSGSTKPVAGGASPACGYKIAYLGVLTGENSGDGVTVRNSAKLAIEKYNRKHSGCTVELVEHDTQRKDDLSLQLARKITDDPQVLGVVGPVYRSEVLAALPVLNAELVPTISPSASDTELTRKDWTVFHRTLGNDNDQAAAAARYLQKILKVTRTYIAADDSIFGGVSSTEVRRTLGNGAVGLVNVKRDNTDYAAAVKQVVDSGADSVYFAGFYDSGAVFVKQLRAAKPSIAIVAGDKVFTDSFVKGAGAGSEGVIITCPCVPAGQAADNYASDYHTRFDEDASYYGPEAFDATNILLSGIGEGRSTRRDLLAYVKAYNGKGVARPVKFTSTGDLDAGGLHIWAYKVSSGAITKEQLIPND